jgi:hypothetical protein
MKLQPIFDDLVTAVLGAGDAEIKTFLDASVRRADEFLALHSTSPAFLELADHAWLQVMQDAGVASLRINRETERQLRIAFIAVIRSLITSS